MVAHIFKKIEVKSHTRSAVSYILQKKEKNLQAYKEIKQVLYNGQRIYVMVLDFTRASLKGNKQ